MDSFEVSKEELERIYTLYRKTVYRMAKTILKCQFTATHITEKSFVLLHNYWTSPKTDEELRDYLLMISAELSLETHKAFTSLSDPDVKEHFDTIHQEILSMPTPYREALMYTLLLKMTHVDACEMMGVNRSLFRVHLYRGQEMLRQKYGENYVKLV